MNLRIETAKKLNKTSFYHVLKEPLIAFIEGPDAERYLHGRITQNVKTLKKDSGAHSLVLTPQGKVQGTFTIYKLENKFLVVSDSLSSETRAEELVSSIMQFKVADRLTLTSIKDTHLLVSVQGAEAGKLLESIFKISLPEPPLALIALEVSREEVFITNHNRGTAKGFDIVLSQKVFLETLKPGLSNCIEDKTGEVLKLFRIASLTPAIDSDITEKTIATEINTTPYVSFNKGCYAGQEVVEMSTARGRPNRMLIGFYVENIGEALGVESSITTEDGTPCGQITSESFLLDNKLSFALGFIKTTQADATSLFVKGIQIKRIHAEGENGTSSLEALIKKASL